MSNPSRVKSFLALCAVFFKKPKGGKAKGNPLELSDPNEKDGRAGAELEFSAKTHPHPPDYVHGNSGYAENQPTDPKEMIH